MSQKHMLMLFILQIFITISHSSQDQQNMMLDESNEEFYNIGQFSTGRISKLDASKNVHTFILKEIENKYLFIKLSSKQLMFEPSISIFDYDTRALIKDCKMGHSDSCYIKYSDLYNKKRISIFVSSQNEALYLLQTYWGSLEHLKPNEQMKFLFNSQNPSQLFHLEFNQDQNFSQIRILLTPITEQLNYDNIKIYANFDINKEPTAEQYDLTSVHAWSDSEGIFLTKKDVAGKNGLFLYIVGNSQTVYILSCEFIQKQDHQILKDETINEYLDAKEQKQYHINFSNYLSLNYSRYVLKFSVFTGEVEINFFKDKEMTDPYQRPPMQYMSDSEFVFTQKQIKQFISDLYIKIKCPDSSSIYQILFEGRQSGEAFMITQNVYEFISVVDDAQMMLYEHSYFTANSKNDNQQTQIVISVILVKGAPTISFYACLGNIKNSQNCKQYHNAKFEQSTDRLTPSQNTAVGIKIIYTLKIDQKYFKPISQIQKKAMILIVLKNIQQTAESSVMAIELSNPNKIHELRDGRAVTDKVNIKKKQYYRYINNNPKISMIRIYYNDISGLTSIKVSRADPRLNDTKFEKPENSKNLMTFTEDVTSPIYLQIQGIVNSIYSLSVFTVHPQHPSGTALTLDEDIQYSLRIQPYSFLNVQIHPIHHNIKLSYNSQSPIRVCRLDQSKYTDCLQGQNNIVGSSGTLDVNLKAKRSAKFRLLNYPTPINPNNIQSEKDQALLPQPVNVKIIYHNSQSNHCEIRKINQLYSQSISSGACLQFKLSTLNEVSIMIRDGNLKKYTYMFYICSFLVDPTFNKRTGRYQLSKLELSKHCGTSNANLMVIFMGSGNDDLLRVEYSIQHESESITLEDGVAYNLRTLSQGKGTIIKRFFYSIHNQGKGLEISMLNIRGDHKFYASIVKESQRYIAAASLSTAPIDSKNRDPTKNPRVLIDKEEIEKVGCQKSCMLVIGVVTLQKAGSDIEYTVQVLQNSIVLNNNQIINDFVGEYSVRYYEYQNEKDNNTLFIRISDHNLHCTKMYLGKYEFPSEVLSLKSDVSGSLVFQNANKGKYFISVEGLSDCLYTISASQSQEKITQLTEGSFFDLQMETDQIKMFIVHHISTYSFKIISMVLFGSFEISANFTNINDIKQIEKFSFNSKYPNILLVNNDSPQFCSDCFYLVRVKALQKSEGSISISSQNSRIRLTDKNMLFDQIQSDKSETLIQKFPVSSGTLGVKVLKGQITVQISHNTHIGFAKQFQPSNSQQIQQFQFSQKIDDPSDPILIKVRALKSPALYSLKIVNKLKDETIRIIPGQYEQAVISSLSNICVTGSIKDNHDYVFLSVHHQLLGTLQDCEITSDINNGQASFTKYATGNIIKYVYETDSIFFKDPLPYKICITTSESNFSLPVNFYQSSVVNLLPPYTETFVGKPEKILLDPGKAVLVDLFQCKGSAFLQYFTLDQDQSTADSHTPQILGLPGQSHAIRLQQSQSYILKVQAQKAILLWMPIDNEAEKGVGYFKYTVGSFDFLMQPDSILFFVKGLSQLRQTATTVSEIKYKIFIAKSRQELRQAINCESYQSQAIFTVSKQMQDISQDRIKLIIKKQKLLQIFSQSENLYCNIVAQMTLLTPQSEHQHYRFIYSEQILPYQLISDIRFSSQKLVLIILAVLLSFVGISLILCIIIRSVLPLIARLRNRLFVQQADQQESNRVSSQRNQLESKNSEALQTEERMQ